MSKHTVKELYEKLGTMIAEGGDATANADVSMEGCDCYGSWDGSVDLELSHSEKGQWIVTLGRDR